MSRSPNLSLPYIQPFQAQKHVTHNLAVELLDALVQLSVTELGVTTPPSDPFKGQVVGIGSGADGEFAGQDGNLACFANGGWTFLTPRNGFTAWVVARGAFYVFQEGSWQILLATGDDTADGLGLNASWNPENRLSVSSSGTLLSHEGAGHRLKVNKAAEDDTASLLFQHGFSGRAEMGLAGDDDFSIKVSADGTDWTNALTVDAQSGSVSIPSVEAAFITGPAIQSAPSDITAGRLMRADWGYGPGNLVGPVAQTGGIPSGSVIESGRTEYGRYTRWADGTQICEAETEVLRTADAVGASYRSTHGDAVWPVPFADVPAVSGTCSYVGGASAMWISTTGPSVTGCGVRLMSATQNSEGRIQLVAYGRWF